MGALLIGILFIFMGTLWFIISITPGIEFNFGYIWPVFLLVPSLLFFGEYLGSKDKKSKYGLLIPANLLFFLAMTFFVNMIFTLNYDYGNIWIITMFMYPGSVAIAFWITWLVSKKGALLIPAVILSFISFLLVCVTMSIIILPGSGFEDLSRFVWPFLFIGFGLLIVLSPTWSRVFHWDNEKEWGKNLGKEMEKMGTDIEKVFEGEIVEEKIEDNE